MSLERMAATDLPILKERRTRGDMTTTHNFLNGFDEVDMEQLCERGRNRSTKRHNRKLTKRRIYSNRVVDGWKRLNEQVLNAENVNRFKMLYKRKGSDKWGAMSEKNFPIRPEKRKKKYVYKKKEEKMIICDLPQTAGSLGW